jgi:alpha-galactosidase
LFKMLVHPPTIARIVLTMVVLAVLSLQAAVPSLTLKSEGNLPPVKPSPIGGVEAYYRTDDGQALTPPMGWNSWNRFKCNIDEQLIRRQADRLGQSGLRTLGYRYVIVDDCWQGGRDNIGTLYADVHRFPSGIQALATYIHKRGLKFGLYSSTGLRTCSGRMGSLGHETLDAQTFARWGVDYLKYDNCDSAASLDEIQRRYIAMGNALRQTGRNIIYSIASPPFQNWHPTIGQLARTGADMFDDWATMINRFDVNAANASFAHPGFWNDPDALEIGVGGMTTNEYKTFFSLWAISAAPLILSIDLINIGAPTYEIITNKDVIAIDQDELGIQATKIAEPAPGMQVWAKQLYGQESWAILFLNRTAQPASMTMAWKDLGISTPGKVRDVWKRIYLGKLPDSYTAEVQPHSVVFLRIN